MKTTHQCEYCGRNFDDLDIEKGRTHENICNLIHRINLKIANLPQAIDANNVEMAAQDLQLSYALMQKLKKEIVKDEVNTYTFYKYGKGC